MEEITNIPPLCKRRKCKAMIQATKYQCSQNHPMNTRCFHVILLSKVTPRYVCCSLILSGVSSKVSLPGWILGESVKRVPVGFSLLMVAHHCSAHVVEECTTGPNHICTIEEPECG
jgi:hypothetical protein